MREAQPGLPLSSIGNPESANTFPARATGSFLSAPLLAMVFLVIPLSGFQPFCDKIDIPFWPSVTNTIDVRKMHGCRNRPSPKS